MDSNHTGAAEHASEDRLQARMSRGAPDWTPLLEAWLCRCANLHLCGWKPLTRWRHDSADGHGRILERMTYQSTCDRTQVQRLNHWMWLDEMLLAWRGRLWCILLRHICLDSGLCVCVDGGPCGWTNPGVANRHSRLVIPVDWDWPVGGGMVSSQQDCLGKTGMSSPQQAEEMPRCSLGKWFGILADSSWTDRIGFVLRAWALGLA